MSIRATFSRFKRVYVADFEFGAPVNGRPAPRCLVVRELLSGQTWRYWFDDLAAMTEPPFDIGPDSLFIGYSVVAELSCFLALGWALPANVIDAWVEFRHQTNGLSPTSSLITALSWNGLESLDVRLKQSMRELAQRDGTFTPDEKRMLLDYCEADVDALARLLPCVVSPDSIEYALLRGRYARAAALVVDNGLPIDAPELARIRAGREGVRIHLANDPIRSLGLYDGNTFKMNRFEELIATSNIPWRRHESGRLDISAETFEEMSELYPTLKPLHQLRKSMSLLQKFDLVAEPDGRIHPGVHPFWTTTGRNQAKASEHIFPHAKWLRGVIRPGPGMALAYLDWAQQEIGIGAALSGDDNMMRAYLADDFYIEFGKLAGILPDWATKESHYEQRKFLKACALGVLYGKGEVRLAADLGISRQAAADLLAAHRRAFPRFWQWLENIVDFAMFHGTARTVFGWHVRLGRNANPRSVMNFPMQANGAEMMRVAAIDAIEAGVRVVGILHDALLIEAPIDRIESEVARTKEAMAKASRVTLGGFELRTDPWIIPYPQTFLDPKDRATWDMIQAALNEIDTTKEVP